MPRRNVYAVLSVYASPVRLNLLGKAGRERERGKENEGQGKICSNMGDNNVDGVDDSPVEVKNRGKEDICQTVNRNIIEPTLNRQLKPTME